MELMGFEVEAETATADDLATDAGRWYAETFGVVPRLTAYATDVEGTTRLTGPGGVTVDVVAASSGDENEASIREFISSAAELEGSPTDELAADVLAIVASAYDAIDARLEGVAHNKVLATMLLVGQQARSDTPDSPSYWQRSAASTLLSSFVGRGAATSS